MDIIKEIRSIIKENKKKPPMFLVEVGTMPTDDTQLGRKRPASLQQANPNPPEDDDPLSGVQASPISQSQQSSMTEKPPQTNQNLKAGFNLYHGIVSQIFTQIQSMSDLGEGGQVVKKVTQWALEHLGHDEDTQNVFATNHQPIQPQQMAAIVQKSMLIALNLIAKEAEKIAEEKHIYSVATKESMDKKMK